MVMQAISVLFCLFIVEDMAQDITVQLLCGIDLAMSMELRLLNWTRCCTLESALDAIKHYKSTE